MEYGDAYFSLDLCFSFQQFGTFYTDEKQFLVVSKFIESLKCNSMKFLSFPREKTKKKTIFEVRNVKQIHARERTVEH